MSAEQMGGGEARRALALRFAPVFSFDSGEEVFPRSFEACIARAALVAVRHEDVARANACPCGPCGPCGMCGGDWRRRAATLAPRGALNAEVLPRFAAPPAQQMALDAPRPGADEGGLHENTPLYFRLRDAGEGCTDVVYVLNYPYNDGSAVACGCCRAGAHQADIEHVTVRLGRAGRPGEGGDWRPLAVFLSQHGGGSWVPWRDVEVQVGSASRPRVYVSRGSHAMSGERGIRLLYCGAAHDRADGRGAYWRPHQLRELDPAEMPFLRFEGRMGAPDSGKMPPRHPWWDASD